MSILFASICNLLLLKLAFKDLFRCFCLNKNQFIVGGTNAWVHRFVVLLFFDATE